MQSGHNMAVLATGAEYVAAGSRMTYSAQFPNLKDFLANLGPAGIVAKIGSNLKNKYNLDVEKFDNGVGISGFTPGSITLYLRTNIDRGDGDTDDGLTDILGNVNDEFRLDGHEPTSSVINDYTPAPSDAQPTPTVVHSGAALPTVQTIQEQAAKNNPDGPSWWDQLTGKLEAGTVGFTIGAVVIVGLLIFVAVKQQV